MDKYNNLTELLLNVIRERPAMFLGRNEISLLPNLILGYHLAAPDDFYFGENGFIKWYESNYHAGPKAGWHMHFLDFSNDNEEEALNLFFEKLDEYYCWYQTIMNGQ